MRRQALTTLRITTSLALTLAAAACGSDDGDGGTSGAGAVDAAAVMGCGDEPFDTYAAGLAKTTASGLVTVKLMEATPAPPDRGDNTWVLELTDSDGAPVDGAAVEAEPFMPAHGHGTSPPLYDATPSGEPGVYDVGPFNLFMPGLWQIRVRVTRDGADPDEAVFAFCVEG